MDPAGVGVGAGVARAVGEPAGETVDERVRVMPTCGGHGSPAIAVPAGVGVPTRATGDAVDVAVAAGGQVGVADGDGVDVGDGDGVDVAVCVAVGVDVEGGGGVTSTVGDVETVEVSTSSDVMPVDAVSTAVAVIGTVDASRAAGRVTGKVDVMPAVGDIAVVVANAMI